MSALALDSATLAEYVAIYGAAARAVAVRNALANPVTVRVYDGGGQIMGQGTMAAPWCTATSDTLTIGEVTSFSVLVSGTPDPASWYLRFESGARWVRGTFGLSASGANFRWSLASWSMGQLGTIGTATLVAYGSSAAEPTWVDGYGSQTAVTFQATAGQTFGPWTLTAEDLDGSPIAIVEADPFNIATIQEQTGTTRNVVVQGVAGQEGDSYTVDLNLNPAAAVDLAGSAVAGAVAAGNLIVPSASAEQDWQDRINSTGPGGGVQWFHAFTTDAEVTKFKVVDPLAESRWPGSSNWIRRSTADASFPGGCLELISPYIPENPAQTGGAWYRPLTCFPGDKNHQYNYDTLADQDWPACLTNYNGSYTAWRRDLYGRNTHWGSNRLPAASASNSTTWTWKQIQGRTEVADFYIQMWVKMTPSQTDFGPPWNIVSMSNLDTNTIPYDPTWMRSDIRQAGLLVTLDQPHGIGPGIFNAYYGSAPYATGNIYIDGLMAQFPRISGRIRIIYGIPSSNQILLDLYGQYTNPQLAAYSGGGTLRALNPQGGKLINVEACGGNYGDVIVQHPPAYGGYYDAADGRTEVERWHIMYGGKEKLYTYFNSQQTSPGGPGRVLPDGYAPGSNLTCNAFDQSGCWRWPKDEWVSVLYHFIPGRNHPYFGITQWGDDVGVWLAAEPRLSNMGIETWAATASEIAAARAAGQPATYRLIHRKFDYKMHYASPNNNDSPPTYQTTTAPVPGSGYPDPIVTGAIWVDTDANPRTRSVWTGSTWRLLDPYNNYSDWEAIGYGPAGINGISLSNYMNDVKTLIPWHRRFAQVIFSHDPIPCPQVAP